MVVAFLLPHRHHSPTSNHIASFPADAHSLCCATRPGPVLTVLDRVLAMKLMWGGAHLGQSSGASSNNKGEEKDNEFETCPRVLQVKTGKAKRGLEARVLKEWSLKQNTEVK